MEYTFQKTTTEKVNMELPAFTKYGGVFYKIMEKKMIIVNTYDFHSSIEISNTNLSMVFGNTGWEFVDEEAYEQAFDKVFKIIKGFKTKAVDAMYGERDF